MLPVCPPRGLRHTQRRRGPDASTYQELRRTLKPEPGAAGSALQAQPHPGPARLLGGMQGAHTVPGTPLHKRTPGCDTVVVVGF